MLKNRDRATNSTHVDDTSPAKFENSTSFNYRTKRPPSQQETGISRRNCPELLNGSTSAIFRRQNALRRGGFGKLWKRNRPDFWLESEFHRRRISARRYLAMQTALHTNRHSSFDKPVAAVGRAADCDSPKRRLCRKSYHARRLGVTISSSSPLCRSVSLSCRPSSCRSLYLYFYLYLCLCL